MATGNPSPLLTPGNEAELVAYFTSGGKPVAEHRIGLEHEKVAILSSGRAPGYETIARILEHFVSRGWTAIVEDGNVIGATHPQSGSFTLEPGGQLEHSGNPHRTITEAVDDNDRHLDELVRVAGAHGVCLLATGFRPFFGLDEIPWMPKGRYVVMRDYLPRYGGRAHDMMKRTATVQANVDYSDEADAIEKLRVGQGVSPIVTSLFAASPIANGKDTGEQSFRASAWLDMDPARCGLLRFLFEPGASFRHYAEWALDVPMFFVYRDGRYHSLAGDGFTFRRFIAEGKFGQKATIADWELHLSTLFPEVRLKKYIEVRQSDASTRAMTRALPALWRGLYASAESRRAAWALVDGIDFATRVALQQQAPTTGLRTAMRGTTVQALSIELVAIAQAGLAEVEPEALPLLAPLETVARTGRTVADDIRDLFARGHGNVSSIADELQIR